MAQSQLTPEERLVEIIEKSLEGLPDDEIARRHAAASAVIAESKTARLVAEERERWIRALCPSCSSDHVLSNGRVWGFCGTRRAIEGGMPEAEIAAAIRARTP